MLSLQAQRCILVNAGFMMVVVPVTVRGIPLCRGRISPSAALYGVILTSSSFPVNQNCVVYLQSQRLSASEDDKWSYEC